MKVTVITVCYNASGTIRKCIESVISQDYADIEYIIIDGASSDQTVQIAAEYKAHLAALISEPDQGLYDAMNKGIALATGDVIGTLNADDIFINNNIISAIVEVFNTSAADIVYGDINMVNASGRIVRKWRSGEYKHGAFNAGWMPPHPAFYAKRELFTLYGNYSLNYGSAADYELMLRFMHNKPLTIKYLNITFLCMLIGGVSNKNVSNRVKAIIYDYKAMQRNNISFPGIAIILKPLRKIFQYLY